MANPRYQTPSSYIGKAPPIGRRALPSWMYQTPSSYIGKGLVTKSNARTDGSGAAPDPAQETGQSFQDWITGQVNRIVQAQIDSVNARKQAYLDELQQKSDLEVARGQALSQALQGMNIPGLIQGIYGNASANIGGLAQAFSGTLRDQALAETAAQQRMLAGTGQEGAVRDAGAAMGDVFYGAEGFIPGRSMGETGAAFAAQAALEPGFAQRIGALKAGDVYASGLEGLRQFTDAILDIEAKRPEIEQGLIKDYNKQLEASAPDISYHNLANGQVQAFDDRTGLPVGEPYGPTKVQGAGKNTVRTLANGQLQAFDSQGRPVGKPYGPVKTDDAPNLQARPLANGQIQWFDPRTGQPVGVPQGPKRTTTKKTAGGKTYNLQLKKVPGGQQWFDPRTGQPVGPVLKAPDTSKPSQKFTASQLAEMKGTAYDSAKAAKLGLTKSDGTVILPPFKGYKEDGSLANPGSKGPREVLQDLVGHGIPFRIAVREVAKFFPVAKKWFKQKNQFSNTQAQPTARNTSTRSVTPEPGAIATPASFRSTHNTTGLGWPAIDIMARPGTPVSAPVSGVIVRHGSAIGGESLYLRGDDGTMYWLGHITGMLPVGTHVARGQTIARISPDHAAPHLHLAKQSGTQG